MRSEACPYLSPPPPQAIEKRETDRRLIEEKKHAEEISYLKKTIDQHYIDCGTKTFNDLDLKHCAFELFLLVKLLWNSSLTLQSKISHKIW